MDIHLIRSTHDRDPIRLFVAGRLEAEIIAGAVQTATDLTQEVEQARCLKALATFIKHWQRDLEKVQTIPDHVEKTSAARQAAFCRGLEAGLARQTVPHPSPGVPPIPPENTHSFERGYSHGEALRRATALALGEAPCA